MGFITCNASLQRLIANIAAIDERYDGDHDRVVAGMDGPDVTWADITLAEAVYTLLNRVQELEQKVAAMSRPAYEDNPMMAEHVEARRRHEAVYGDLYPKD